MIISKKMLSLFLIILIFSSCRTPEVTTPAKQTEELAFETSKVLSQQPLKFVKLPGELHPWNTVIIYSKVKGYVRELKVDRGSTVKKGQILAVLDAPEILTELNQARGQLFAAEAAVNSATQKHLSSKLTYGRLVRAGNTSGAISPHELEQAKSKMQIDSTEVFSAKGNLSAAKSHYNTKSEMMKYLEITAPFDAIVTERNVSPGTLIGSTETTPLFTLEDNTRLRLTVSIPEIYSGALHKSSIATFNVLSFVNREFQADFGRSSHSIIRKNRMMVTEFDVDNKNGELKAGMYTEIKIAIKRPVPTLFVPTTSIINSSEKVFLIRAEASKAEWVEVKKGFTTDSLTEVFGDLKVGELIVKDASEEIRDGELIKIK